MRYLMIKFQLYSRKLLIQAFEIFVQPHLHGRLLAARIDILPSFFLKSRTYTAAILLKRDRGKRVSPRVSNPGPCLGSPEPPGRGGPQPKWGPHFLLYYYYFKSWYY